MRLRAIFFAVAAFAAAGAAAWKAGGGRDRPLRGRHRRAGARRRWSAADQGWASVATDGLKVTLAGAAPDETSRFRALEIARQIVDARRIEDTTTLAAAKPLPPAPFALELLRNEAEVSLIGLVPRGRRARRDPGGAQGRRAGGERHRHAGDRPRTRRPRAGRRRWASGSRCSPSCRGRRSAWRRGRCGWSPSPTATTTGRGWRSGCERAKPDGVALDLEISAPRAVIAPFAFDFSLEDGVGRMDACSAESPEAAAAILAAAEAAGLPAGADCRVGLGAPSPGWPVAVAQGLEALRGAGRRALHPQRHGGGARAARGRAGRRGGGGGGEARRRACRTASGWRRRCRRWSPPRQARRRRRRSSRRRSPSPGTCGWPGR